MDNGGMRRRATIESRLSQADPALGRVIDAVIMRIGPQRITPSRASPFEALVRAVVYQSVSGKAAESIYARLKETVATSLTPPKILALHPQSLSKAGLSKAKVQTIRVLAKWFVSNRKMAKALPTLSDAEIVGALTALPGVGAWTVNVFLIFNLNRLDVMPTADQGIRRGIQLTDGVSNIATPKQVLERSKVWTPYRSIASIYLWQAMKLRLQQRDLIEGKRSPTLQK
jgi:DNA-3-methyladenine glycosylase II